MWVDDVTHVDLCKFDISDSTVSENFLKSYQILVYVFLLLMVVSEIRRIASSPTSLSLLNKMIKNYKVDSLVFSDTLMLKKISNFWKQENDDLCETVMYWPILRHYGLSLLEVSFWYLTFNFFFFS